MATRKLEELEFRARPRGQWTPAASAARALYALCCLSLCACSVYDAHLLTERNMGGISEADSGIVADSGESEAVKDCVKGEDTPCIRQHSDANCVEGVCIIQRCKDGYVDCDGDSANGCEAKLDTPQNCGLCGAACRYNHASASCDSATCKLAKCDRGYDNCDGNAENGCETDLNTLANCGGCGKTCSERENANPGCKDLACGVGTCIGPFGDCDGKAENGCEQRLNTADHCGKCDGKCDPAHGEGTCDSGSCLVTKCDPGFADCNGRAADGCETALDDPNNCGACGVSCELAHVENAACEKSDDKYRCVVTHACDPETSDCGQEKTVLGCDKGYGDCDNNTANGCETDLSRLLNCGGCGKSCVKANTTSECREGKCVDTGCAPGASKCGGSNDCRDLSSDAQNCGKCGTACPDGQMCAGGRCTAQMCAKGLADCNASDQNDGCETTLNSNNNCGLCGQNCPARAHAGAACRDGKCGIGNCEDGWKDCDGDPSNGCEVNIRTTNDCGDCAKACVAANAETTCANGQCRIGKCVDGRGDCNSDIADGCEADFNLPATCGGCGNKCVSEADVLSSSCEAGKCNLVCGPGRADCDQMSANGCEADLKNAASCGSCNNDCTKLANVASATCDGGACRNVMCKPGFADCNGDPADGCERSLNTTTDCGACNKVCAPAHGAGQCTNGTCGSTACDPGFADCNTQPDDGCETPLSTAQNCGTCGNACRDGTTCINGRCGCMTDADCGGNNGTCCDGVCTNVATTCFPFPCIPGADTPTSSQTNCGGCGQVCLFWCCVDLAKAAGQ